MSEKHDRWAFWIEEGDTAVFTDEVGVRFQIRVISLDGPRVRLEVSGSLKDHPIVNDEELQAQKQAELEAFYQQNPTVKRWVDEWKKGELG